MQIAPAMNEPGKFLKGRLLLDGGNLRGSFFHRTVVLICEHNAEGAFGLVLNRTAGIKVHKLAVSGLARSGKPAELLAHFGIDAAAIVNQVKSL